MDKLENCDTINLRDTEGRKKGLWTEGKTIKTEVYYENGLKNGIFKSYHRNGKLYCIGQFKNDSLFGIWYSFKDTGFLDFKIVYNQSDKKTGYNYKSFLTYFYCNGNIKEEGIILHQEDFEIDFIKDSTWSYLNEKGIKFKEEYYQNGELINTTKF